MITPGPVVITVAFIGYLVAGMFGGLSAALGVFLPCYLFVILPAPYFQRLAKNPWIAAFAEGVTAAATGAIAGAAIVLGRRAITDRPTALVGGATFLVLWKAHRVPEPLVILVDGAAGSRSGNLKIPSAQSQVPKDAWTLSAGCLQEGQRKGRNVVHRVQTVSRSMDQATRLIWR